MKIDAVEFDTLSNPRTDKGGWKYDLKCDGCGCMTSAYVVISILFGHFSLHIRLCKSCLDKGHKMIDETIRNQTEWKVQK